MNEKIKLTTICYPQLRGGYTIVCPELGLFTQGENLVEAENMIKELVDDFFKHQKTMDFSDYVEAFNVGHKIITEIDYEYSNAN